MPTRKNRNARNGRRNRSRRRQIEPISGRDTTVTDTGKCQIQPTLVANVATLVQVNPNSFNSRLAAGSDIYEQFRFVSMRIRMYPSGNNFAIGYSKTQLGTPPTSTSILLQTSASRFNSALITVPTELLLGPDLLIKGTITKWWDCNNSVPQLTNQGVLVLISPQAVSPILEISYMIQWRGDTNPSELLTDIHFDRAYKALTCPFLQSPSPPEVSSDLPSKEEQLLV